MVLEDFADDIVMIFLNGFGGSGKKYKTAFSGRGSSFNLQLSVSRGVVEGTFGSDGKYFSTLKRYKCEKYCMGKGVLDLHFRQEAALLILCGVFGAGGVLAFF